MQDTNLFRETNVFSILFYELIYYFAKETHKIKLHKPYPDNKLKRYQIDLVAKELTNKGLI